MTSDELWQRYLEAAGAVRFQVQLGEARATRFIAFVGALLVAGSVADSVYLYILGSLAAVLSSLALYSNHEYYRSARDTMLVLAAAVDKEAGEPVTVRATPGQGATPRKGWLAARPIRIQTIQHFMLAGLCLVGIVGAILTWV